MRKWALWCLSLCLILGLGSGLLAQDLYDVTIVNVDVHNQPILGYTIRIQGEGVDETLDMTQTHKKEVSLPKGTFKIWEKEGRIKEVNLTLPVGSVDTDMNLHIFTKSLGGGTVVPTTTPSETKPSETTAKETTTTVKETTEPTTERPTTEPTEPSKSQRDDRPTKPTEPEKPSDEGPTKPYQPTTPTGEKILYGVPIVLLALGGGLLGVRYFAGKRKAEDNE